MIRAKNITPPRRINRRRFLAKAAHLTAAAIFPYVVRSSALGKAGTIAPGNRIVLGFIGAGEQCQMLLGNFLNMQDVQIPAVCDCRKSKRLATVGIINERYGNKDCADYNDFRELIADPAIDAVVIASPDHWHVLHAIEAARAGKDIYMEKPVGVSVESGQVLQDVIRSTGCVFQFGTQQRSDRNFRFACELALNKRIGKLHTIKAGLPHYIPAFKNYPVVPVPQGTDYDMWLGPAPWAPYMTERIEALNAWEKLWWHISDYSLGWISGWGIHHIDIAQWGNGTELTGPVEVEGTAEFAKEGLCDNAFKWNVKITYANGVVLDFTDDSIAPQGVRFIGTDGWVFVNRELIDANPKSLLEEKIAPSEIHLPVSSLHERNFIDCVKTQKRTIAPVESAICSDIICHLADIATRLGRKLRWNPETETFVNDQQANRMLKRSMRSPWYF